ncbi:MAG: preprotein translocase subunit YajC [Clostridia bacterium]|nr:preprotein translocase subunit YajC [Clostridia bacterium]
MVLLLAVFYFMLIRPQKKREKAERELRNNLQNGDKIITIGGFTGRVINIRDDEVTFETGAAKTRLTVKKWAIQTREETSASVDAGDEIRTKPETLPEENK